MMNAAAPVGALPRRINSGYFFHGTVDDNYTSERNAKNYLALPCREAALMQGALVDPCWFVKPDYDLLSS